nr:hypothetical protein [Tanacetum cinerariifolium]
MSADFAVTYSSVHSEARSWSIPSEDPYKEAAQQLFEQAPHPPEYVPRDHVPVFVPEFEHPEDLVPAEGTPPLLPISTPSTSHRAGIPEANTPPQNRPLLATPRPGCEVGESSTAKDRAAVRAEIEVLRNERLAYEQDGIQTREALTRSEAHCRTLEARVAVLETHAHRLEWQRQAADDFAVEHIMRTQALEARACDDTLEDAGYVAESDPEEDPEEYEEDEAEDGPVDYLTDGGDDDDDGNSSGYDADDEDEDNEDKEEEDEHLAPADSVVVIPIDELVSPPEGTKPTIPPPSTDTTAIGARITIRPHTSISLPPEPEVEKLLAMPTPPPSPLTSLSPPSAPAALPSPSLPPFFISTITCRP